MQRFLIFVAVCLLSGCLTAPPKAAKPTLMPRAQSYRDLTHLPSPTGKYLSPYTTFRMKPGNLNLTRQVTSPRPCRKKRHRDAGYRAQGFALVYSAGTSGLSEPVE
jgi:hypothetical protein